MDAENRSTAPSGPRVSGAPRVAPPTALPSVTARVLGFVAIVVAGGVGGFIGYGFTATQCRGDCATPDALGALVGAVVGAVGVAIVVVLALRAMGEWRSIQRPNAGPQRPAIPPTRRPRVR